MKNREKIMKQNSLGSRIIIKFCLAVVALALVFVLIRVFGSSFSAVVGVFLVYKLLRLIFRVIGLVFALFFSLFSIGIIITVISLLIM